MQWRLLPLRLHDIVVVILLIHTLAIVGEYLIPKMLGMNTMKVMFS